MRDVVSNLKVERIGKVSVEILYKVRNLTL